MAANPTKRGTYTGQDSKEVKLVLKVSSNGTTGKADLYCSSSHVSAIHSFAIAKGRFYGIRKSGTTKIFSIKGSFTSATAATGHRQPGGGLRRRNTPPEARPVGVRTRNRETPRAHRSGALVQSGRQDLNLRPPAPSRRTKVPVVRQNQ